MDLHGKPFEIKAVIIGMLVMLLWFFMFLFWVEPYGGNLFMPAMGVALFFAVVYGRKIYPAIAFGSLSGFLPQVLIFRLGHPFSGILYSLLVIIIFMVMLESFLQSFRFMRIRRVMARNLLDGFLSFFAITFIQALVFGFMFALAYELSYDAMGTLLQRFVLNASGIMVSIGLLTPLLYLGKYYDQKRRFLNPTLQYTLNASVLILFVIVSAFIMQGAWNFSYGRHLYGLVFFFLLGAILFSYWILLAKFLLISMFYWYFIFDNTLAFNDLMVSFGSFMAFLLVTYVVSMTLKYYYDLKLQQNDELKALTGNLNHTLDYVNKFLRLSKDISLSKYDSDVYAKETFEVTKMVFDEADRFFSFYDEKGELTMRYVQGYGVNKIPYFYDLYDSHKVRNKEFYLIENVKEHLEKSYPEANIYTLSMPVETRVYMVFHFNPEQRYIIACDFMKRDNMTAARIKQMHDFTHLFNKLFLKHHITKQNLDIKDDIILTFVRTLNYYDRYTKGHSEAVATLARSLAEKMALNDSMVEEIYLGGLLHDVGKLGIRSSVLNKKARLTRQEYEHIKKHVSYSYDVLKDAKPLEDVAKIVRDHHEWWDGSGYPRGIKGHKISLGGRILAISDAVATMHDERPYKKKMDDAEIIKELQQFRRIQFCPITSDTMIQLIKGGILETI